MKDSRFDDDAPAPTLAELFESACFEAGLGLPAGEIMGEDLFDGLSVVRMGGHDGRAFFFNPKNRSSH